MAMAAKRVLIHAKGQRLWPSVATGAPNRSVTAPTSQDTPDKQPWLPHRDGNANTGRCFSAVLRPAPINCHSQKLASPTPPTTTRNPRSVPGQHRYKSHHQLCRSI